MRNGVNFVDSMLSELCGRLIEQVQEKFIHKL